MQIIYTNKDNAASAEDTVLTLQDQNTRYNIRCNQEKTHTIVFLHAGGIFSTSSSPHLLTKLSTLMSLPLLQHYFPILNSTSFEQNQVLIELIEFDSGLHRITVYNHVIYEELGHDASKELLFFHAFTKGDEVSVFVDRKKETA